MSTISNTVTSTLTSAGLGSYSRHAAPVIAALEEREASIVAAVREVASDKGLSAREVDSILVQVGLAEPAPAAATTEGGTLARIEATLNGLVSFARGHGYRG